MAARGEANGASPIIGNAKLIEAARTAEQHLVGVHAHASKTMDFAQKGMNRLRSIRQALEDGKFEAHIPHYPIREVEGGVWGQDFEEPRELTDLLEEDSAVFEDAKGQRYRLTLLPVWEPVGGVGGVK